jgi:hypothetical protein
VVLCISGEDEGPGIRGLSEIPLGVCVRQKAIGFRPWPRQLLFRPRTPSLSFVLGSVRYSDTAFNNPEFRCVSAQSFLRPAKRVQNPAQPVAKGHWKPVLARLPAIRPKEPRLIGQRR